MSRTIATRFSPDKIRDGVCSIVSRVLGIDKGTVTNKLLIMKTNKHHNGEELDASQIVMDVEDWFGIRFKKGLDISVLTVGKIIGLVTDCLEKLERLEE